jgi:tRNA A37 threonylcarbamoyltransferase TsaD
MILGIECTAHTFGVAVVDDGKILSNEKDTYTTEKGGIVPLEAAKHHIQVKEKVYKEALEKANTEEKKIEAIAISNAPGLAPCLLEGLKFAKELA